MRADRAVDGPSAVAEKRADRDVEASTQINEVWVKARAKSDIRARDVRWVALEHTENEDVPQAVSDRMVRVGTTTRPWTGRSARAETEARAASSGRRCRRRGRHVSGTRSADAPAAP